MGPFNHSAIGEILPMSFSIIRMLEQPPDYQRLRKLADQHNVQVNGNERAGTFSCRGLEGDYEFVEDGLRGKFSGHGVTGEFCFEKDKAAVTVTEKPFWLPELILKKKITEGLDMICNQKS